MLHLIKKPFHTQCGKVCDVKKKVTNNLNTCLDLHNKKWNKKCENVAWKRTKQSRADKHAVKYRRTNIKYNYLNFLAIWLYGSEPNWKNRHVLFPSQCRSYVPSCVLLNIFVAIITILIMYKNKLIKDRMHVVEI